MLKDDRMMSMLTFLVVMVAIGTVIQRADVVGRFFGDGITPLALHRDEAIVRANVLTSIDVLANDQGLDSGDAQDLIVVRQPDCGRVFVEAGQVKYLPAERCVGSQRFYYSLSGRSNEHTGEVAVVVRAPEPGGIAANTQRDVNAPTPMAPRAAEQQTAKTPALEARLPAQPSETVGSVATAPAAPRPQAPASAPQPSTMAVDGSGTTSPSLSALEDNAATPGLTVPAGGLAMASGDASAPAALPSTRSAPAEPAPQTSTTGQSADASPPAGPGETAGLSVEHGDATLDPGVSRASLPRLGTSGANASVAVDPAVDDVLAAVRSLGSTTGLAPVDTTPPTPLAEPGRSPGAGQTQGEAQGNSGESSGSDDRVTALTPAAEPCTIPPALILDVQPAGMTEVILDAPCQAGTVAELSYDGLGFGIPLDQQGAGSTIAFGLQQSSDAVVRFAGGETLDFHLPFADTERMDRVALAWELPVDLDLHAFEFGAVPGSGGHVRPKYRRSFAEVRRDGGGYMLEYRPVGLVGQRIEVYTFWRRHGGPSGVINLKVDFASRGPRKRPDTCLGGRMAEPDFTVLRSLAGVLDRPRRHSVVALDCAVVAAMEDRYIGDAVDDLIVSRE